MTWFLMLFNGRWRKHTKLCGIPYLIMVDLSGNKLSWIWKALDVAYEDVVGDDVFHFTSSIE